jgi:lia operon protein LiaF
MAAYSRKGTLFGGLILIGLGAIFLIETWYQPFSAWHLIARYWPLILIIIGIRKLYGYFTWNDDNQATGGTSPEQPRSH